MRLRRYAATDGLSAASAVLIAFTWVWWKRHGIPEPSLEPIASSVGQLSGIYAFLASCAGLILAGRPRYLEQGIGLDRVLVWHRRAGASAAVFVGVHVAAELVAAAGISGYAEAFRQYLLGGTPYMALATAGAGLFAVVTMSSIRAVRRRLSYETWYFVHLLAYAGVALSFLHQVRLGVDLVFDDTLSITWWVVGIGSVVAAIVGRWGTALGALLRPHRVIAVTQIGNVTELVVQGPRRTGSAGQFAMLRPLVRGLWWQSHPFSLAAAPDNGRLTFLIKHLGDASRTIGTLRVGTRIAVEGPYGAITAEQLDRPVLMIGGGVGIAPIRALAEQAPRGSSPVVLFRARSNNDLGLVETLREQVHRAGGRFLTVVGRRSELGYDPLSPDALLAAVPDIANRCVVICGPETMIRNAHRSLRSLGIGDEDIHYERTWW